MAAILNAEDVVVAVISKSKVVNKLQILLSECTSSTHDDAIKRVEAIVFKEATVVDNEQVENC